MDMRCLPESVVLETAEYKCLQSQFSVLYNESMQLKTQLEESRQLLASSKNSHLRHIEQMEGEELLMQKKLRTEVIRLEDALVQVGLASSCPDGISESGGSQTLLFRGTPPGPHSLGGRAVSGNYNDQGVNKEN